MLWGDAAPPAELRELLARLAEAARLVAVETGDEGVVAYRSPDEIEIGWPTLAASTVFAAAWSRMPARAPHVLYVDLQQLVEIAVRTGIGPSAVRERVARGLALRGLQSAVLALTANEKGWRGSGVIATSGVDVGLPGLLTSELEGRTVPPAAEPGAVVQVESFFDPEVAEGVVKAVTAIQERSFVSGLLAGPARALDQVASQLGGRTRWTMFEGGAVQAAAQVRDATGLLEALEQLLSTGGGPPPESMEIRDGWAVVSLRGAPEWKAPEGEATATGPFFWLRSGVGGGELTVDLRRRARDLVGVELSLAPR